MVPLALDCILLNIEYHPPDTHPSNKISLWLKLSPDFPLCTLNLNRSLLKSEIALPCSTGRTLQWGLEKQCGLGSVPHTAVAVAVQFDGKATLKVRLENVLEIKLILA